MGDRQVCGDDKRSKTSVLAGIVAWQGQFDRWGSHLGRSKLFEPGLHDPLRSCLQPFSEPGSRLGISPPMVAGSAWITGRVLSVGRDAHAVTIKNVGWYSLYRGVSTVAALNRDIRFPRIWSKRLGPHVQKSQIMRELK